MKIGILTASMLLAVAAFVAVPYIAHAADAKPAETKDSVDRLEERAKEAMGRTQYSLAKDLFTKVLDRVKDDAKRTAAIQEQIKTCETKIKENASSAQPDQLNQPQVETAAEKRKKHVAPKDGSALALGIKELGNFDYDADKGGNIPQDVKDLSGHKIRVQGFMIPLDQADNISHFALVPSLFACCFGQPPQIQHQIVVHTPKGKAVSYFPDEIVCEGTLKVEEKKDDGYIVSVFEMDVQSVKPAAK